jgi:hypothetical protein
VRNCCAGERRIRTGTWLPAAVIRVGRRPPSAGRPLSLVRACEIDRVPRQGEGPERRDNCARDIAAMRCEPRAQLAGEIESQSSCSGVGQALKLKPFLHSYLCQCCPPVRYAASRTKSPMVWPLANSASPTNLFHSCSAPCAIRHSCMRRVKSCRSYSSVTPMAPCSA